MPKRSKFQIRSRAAKKQRLRVRDEQKESFWRGHLDAWQTSELSKRAYCQEHNLAYASFLYWCREIESRDREHGPAAKAAAILSKSPEKGAIPFVPIRLVPDKVKEEKQQDDAPMKKAAEKQQIEIALPNGAVIRLNDGCNASFVAKLLSALKV